MALGKVRLLLRTVRKLKVSCSLNFSVVGFECLIFQGNDKRTKRSCEHIYKRHKRATLLRLKIFGCHLRFSLSPFGGHMF